MSERIESLGRRTTNRATAAAVGVMLLLPMAAQAANVSLMSKGLPYSTAFAGGFPDNPYAISGDGCLIAYTSYSAQIVPGQADGNGGSDVFLFDRCAGKRLLISHVGDEKTTGNKDSFFPKISRDGSVVVFSSLATDLVSSDTGKDVNNGEDLFAYDVATAKIFLISGAAADPEKTGDKPSGANADYVVSADGRFVAFSSDATDLSTTFTDGNGELDVYHKDWAAQVIQLVSHVKDDPDKPGNGRSERPSVSRDGGTVAFQSDASDLLGDSPNDAPGMDIFVWGGGNGVLASRAGGSDTRSVGSSINPVISGNQDYVAFESVEKADVFNPAWGDANGQADIFLFRTIDRTLGLVSHRLGAPNATAGGESLLSWSGVALPSLTDPGSFLAYTSTAPDLATGQGASDRGGAGPPPDFEDSDVFLYDLLKNESDLVSMSSPGAPKEADGYSYAPVVSVGSLGRPSVAYVSVARDLVSGQVDANDPFVGDYFLWAGGENALVSHTDGNNFTTAVASSTGGAVALSADAKFVAFGSDAPDIVLGDTNAEIDAFAYEASTKKNTLVSEGEVTIIDAGANNISSPTFAALPYARSSVSANGDLVAFVSFATNLLSGQADGNGLGSDVFLYDRSDDKVVALVSHAVGAPLSGGNGPSDEPVISRDGAFVAFRSGSTNLVTGPDLNGGADIFVYEVATGTVTLVSHAAGLPTTAGNGTSSRPVLNTDAKLLAFVSTSSNLVAGQSDVGSDQDVFRWDRANNLNELVSHAAASVVQGAASGGSFEPAISPNGRYVAYTSKATDILAPQVDGAGTNDVFVWDDFDKQNRLVSHQAMPVILNAAANGPSDRPSVAENTPANSAYVVFRSLATNVVQSQVDTNAAADIVLWHNNEKRLVSKQPLAPTTTANGESDQPLLSDDNRFIAFQTRATNIGLGATDVNGTNWDVYVADRAAIEALASTANRLVSHAASVPTSTANATSLNPSINGKGDFVAFESSASNLVAGQLSASSRNLFLWQRGGNVSALLSHKLGDGRTTGNSDPSENSMLAAAAPIVAFSSYASDLVTGDLNGSILDAFVAEGLFTDLRITKTSSGVATPGAPFSYTIVAENLGPENAPGSTVTDNLPFPLDNPPTYTATWTCVGSGGGTCGSASGTSDINETVDLPVGANVTFTVVGTLALAPDSGNLVNMATIVGPVADPDVANNTSTVTDVLTPIADLNLTLTDSPDPVLTGAPLTYVATLTNTGPSNANSTTLTVTLPSTAIFQSFNSPVPGCSFGGVTLACAFGVVGPGISIPVTISMTAPPGQGTINASAAGGSLTSTPVSANADTEVIAPGSAAIDIATVTSKYYENTLEWLTPPAATGYVATVIRFSSAGFPATVADGSPLPGGFMEPGPDFKGKATHAVIDNGVHYYSLFVDKGGTFSGPKQVRGRTFENGAGFPEEPVQWAFTMGITSVTAPTVGTNAIVTVSNDRGVYAMQRGTALSSGLWPDSFWPLKLQGIAQNRSPVVNTTIGGASRAVFVGAQDGRVYAIDADAGGSGSTGPLWTSGLLGATSPQVQAAPAGIFSVFGSGLSEDLILIGSRDSTATTNIFYGLKARQPLGGSGLWLFNPGGASPMGIVSGGGSVDYPTKRVWFGSRQKSGGPTLWCLQFDETTVSGCGGSWPITNPNGFDQSPVLRAGKIYIGDNLSDVHCFDAISGASCGSSGGFDLVPDGPVKGFVFPDRLSGDLYASTTNKVWGWTDTGAAIGFKPGWPGSGVTAIPNPSIPLFVRLASGPPYLYVGSSNGRLYQIDTTNPTVSGIKWVELGGGGAVIGAPSLDLANGMVIVGSDSGVIYGVKVPLLP